MRTMLVGVCGGLVGAGLALIRTAWQAPLRSPRQPPWPGWRPGRGVLRVGAAVVCGAVVFTLSRWPVLALTATLIGLWLPTAWAARGRAQRELGVVESLATWAEQLRDTLSAASGLEHAVTATARLEHGPIGPACTRLADRLTTNSLSVGLRQFAQDVRHPSADFVAAALITASEHQARDVAALLGHLATSARDEARLRRRVWVGRARLRSAGRVILGVTVVVVVGLEVLSPAYLDAYGDTAGQLVLGAIISLFALAFAVMERLSRLTLPERFSLREPTRRRSP